MARSDRCFALAASALLVLTGLTASQSTVPILTDGDVKVGTILASEVEEFHVDVNVAEFRQNPYDMHIILDVIAGDCDLVVKGPNRFMVYSEHPSGADVLYVSRESIMNVCGANDICPFRVLVVGYSESAEWEMTYDIETTERTLHPDDKEVLETIYSKCCNSMGSCSSWYSAVEASGVGETRNFCHFPNQICNANGRITHLDLSDSALQCELPPELGRLKTLERLYLEDNSITGSFPDFVELTKGMRNLKHVHMSDNRLSGDLSCCPADDTDCLHHLKTLEFKRNDLTGDLPACLLALPALGVLNLRENSLSGTFPSPLPANPLMVVLDVRDQKGSGMRGQLPDFTPFSKLALLGLSNNDFSGPFPAIPPKLEAIHLTNNSLTGAFHSTADELENIWIFESGNNAITGALPPSLATSKTLKLLNVQGNALDEPLPTIWEAENLRILELNGNRLPGPVPASLASLTRLIVLNMTDNALSGSLDGFAGMLGFNQLRQFSISRNLLVGSIPSTLSRLQSFSLFPSFDSSAPQLFDLSFNSLDGEFPVFLMSSLLQLASSDLYDFDFEIQGNKLACPPDDVKDVITQKIPDLAATTCSDPSTGSLRTIGGAKVPDNVASLMEEVNTRGRLEPELVGPSISVDDSPLISRSVVDAESAEAQAIGEQQPPAGGDGVDNENKDDGLPLPVFIGIAAAVGVVVIVALVLVALFVVRPMVAKRKARKYEEYNGDEAQNPRAPVIPGKTLPSDAEAPVPTMTDIEMS